MAHREFEGHKWLIGIPFFWAMLGLAPRAHAQLIAAPDRQIHPKVAAGGNEYLAVWQDRRNGSNFDVFAARVGTDGSLLDNPNVRVANAATNEVTPDVGYRTQGATYLAVWAQAENIVGAQDVFARPVSDGAVMGAPFAVANGLGDQRAPVIACQSCDCVVAYEEATNSGPSSLKARIVKCGGGVNPAVTLATPAGTTVYDAAPRITPAGTTDFYVTWTHIDGATSTAWGTRLRDNSGSLTVLDSTPVVLSSGVADTPSGVLSDGMNALVVYRRGSGPQQALYGRLVSASTGAPASAEVNIAPVVDQSASSGLLRDGTSYLVTWQDFGLDGVGARHLNASTGALLDDRFLLTEPAVPGADTGAAQRFTATAVVVWDDLREGAGEDIFGRVIPVLTSAPGARAAAAVTTDFLISTASSPAVPATNASSIAALTAGLCLLGVALLRRRAGGASVFT